MPAIQHQLLIAAKSGIVYSAITTQKGLSAWWTPDTIAIPEHNSIARFGFGADYFKEMKVVALDPSKHVQWLCIRGADEWMGTTVSFTILPGDRAGFLDDHGEMTDQLQQLKADSFSLLVFRHDGWKKDTAMFAECNYTWGRFLRSLKLFCETGKGMPWPNQHRV